MANKNEEKELSEVSTMRKFGISEFSTKPTNFYNLELIIAVGFRVKSVNGTKFRIWANEKLKYTMQRWIDVTVDLLKFRKKDILLNAGNFSQRKL